MIGVKRKFLVLAAIISLSGAVSAQSSVTLWGIVDANFERFSQGGLSKNQMSTSGNSASQIGFKGVEDLGQGSFASFWLEGTLVNSNGTGSATGGQNPSTGGGMAFGRRSTIDVGGSFGAIRFGRDITPTFWSHAIFDPFGALGVGASTNITQTGGVNGNGGANPWTAARANNSISYLWGMAPNAQSHGLGSAGLYTQLMYAIPGNPTGTPDNGRYAGGRVGYASGPINMAVAYSESRGPQYVTTPASPIGGASAVAGSSVVYKEFNIGGSYLVSGSKLMARTGFNKSEIPGSQSNYWLLGASIVVGEGSIPISYASVKAKDAFNSGASQFAVGYVYNLSKRTAIYTTVSKITSRNGGVYSFMGANGGGNSGFSVGSVAGQNGSGFDFGVRTSF